MQGGDWLIPSGHGVYAIDTGFQRPRFDAAYLIVDDGRAAFVDTGTRHALPRLLGALDSLGLAVEDVDWVIPTHVHLDHAGGVGPRWQAGKGQSAAPRWVGMIPPRSSLTSASR